MSDVEDIIERIKCQSGVEGYIICSQKGEIIRQSYDLNDEKYANKIVPLCLQARELCRDLNPKVIIISKLKVESIQL